MKFLYNSETKLNLKKVNSKTFLRDAEIEQSERVANIKIRKSEVEKLYRQYTNPTFCNETYMFNMVSMFMMLLTKVF